MATTPYVTAGSNSPQHEPAKEAPRAAPSQPKPQGPAREPNTNVVHESTASRQHVRVRLPGIVEFPSGKETVRCKLYDLSAGGFSFESGGRNFRTGEAHRGSIVLNVDGVAITLFVGFHVKTIDAKNARIGCTFQEIGQQEISVLRHIITSFLSGEVVSVGEVLHTLARDNFTKPRAAPKADPGANLQGGSRMKALLGTAALLVAGVVAFAYTARQVDRMLFASVATAGKVAGPVYSVLMPREGTFYSLVPEDGVVKKGAPLGSFEAPALDLVRNQTLGANLSPEQLQKLLKVTIKGTITSPCDCRVQNQFVANGQYVSRDQPIFELMPRDFKPYLVARFRQSEMDDLSTGGRVQFRVSGESATRVGKISQVRAQGEGDSVDSDIIAVVEPVEPLPAELLHRPAEVVAGGLGGLPGVLPSLTARASGSDEGK